MSTLKSAVFGSSSSMPLLVCEGGGLVCESADLQSDHVNMCKQSRKDVICRSLLIHLPVLPPLRSDRVG